MQFVLHTINNKNIIELLSNNVVINEVDDALDLMGSAHYMEADKTIVYEHQLCPGFFDLSTKIAGEILQKFSTYQMQLAIVGNFEKHTSKSLRDFIYESNKMGRILFVSSVEEAKDKLSK